MGFRNDERGISEVLAFIFVFAIIITSVGVLYSVGFSSMNDYQENEQLRNAERAMEALGDNFDDIHRHAGVGQRHGELSLRQGTVVVDDESTQMNVTAGSEGPIFEDENASFVDGDNVTLGTFEYRTGSDWIAYQGSGLFRGDDSGSAVLEVPPIRKTDEGTLVVSMVAIESDGRSLQSGEMTGFTATDTDERVAVTDSSLDDENVTITIHPEPGYETGWVRALERAGAETEPEFDETDGTIEAEFTDIDAYTVNVVGIEIDF
ncbi:hypothetical protein ACFQGT_01025 [Natrialbaceae archaeon GCM10025810]